MLKILQNETKDSNDQFIESKRKKNEDNLAWCKRHFPKDKTQTILVLIGGKGGDDFRLRVAQSHLRHDLTPSNWSHVALLSNIATDISKSEVIEIALNPARGFGHAPETNGVQKGRLDYYKDATVFPNVALLSVPVPAKAVEAMLTRYQTQRAILDTVELIVIWLSFVWGVGRTGNPLLDGNGIPSAAMIEVLLSSCQYELTPGLPSRASCPEAIWQSAKWWHEYYDQKKLESAKNEPDRPYRIIGAYCVDHILV